MGEVLEGEDVVVFHKRHHDAGRVVDRHGLGLVLGPEHNVDHKGIGADKKHRNSESCEQEGLLLYLVEVFPSDDDIEFLEVHTLLLRDKFDEYVVHSRDKLLEGVDGDSARDDGREGGIGRHAFLK